MSIQQNWAETYTLSGGRVDQFVVFPTYLAGTPANDVADAIALSGPGAAAKRALDLIIAISALIVLAPVLLAIAVAVALDSPGPILFRQTRLGLNGKPFRIFKFRTMTVTEDGAAIAQARRNDPRVTALGRVLRAWSLDELPQLFNVISGDMSLVGPRPHARAHDEHYAALIGHYALRQRVKPGITGWAQVNGRRGETPTVSAMRERVDLDVWYVAHAGVAMDLAILWRTFAVLAHTNAY